MPDSIIKTRPVAAPASTDVFPISRGSTDTFKASMSNLGGVSSGTRALFRQNSAPTGWTKITSFNDAVLRVVNGVASSGGSLPFSSAFTSRPVSASVAGVFLTSTQTGMPAHSHQQYFGGCGRSRGGCEGGNNNAQGYSGAQNSYANSALNAAEAHTHTIAMSPMNFSVSYVDTIIASKN